MNPKKVTRCKLFATLMLLIATQYTLREKRINIKKKTFFIIHRILLNNIIEKVNLKKMQRRNIKKLSNIFHRRRNNENLQELQKQKWEP